MSDPTRFVDDHPSDFARSLLNAGLDDEPPATLLERTLVPLGFAAATTVATEVAHAATTGATVGVATTTPPAVAIGSSLFVTTVKWVGIASIGGGLVVGAATGLSPKGGRDSQAPTVQAPAKVAAAPAARPRALAEPVELAESPEPTPEETAPAPESTTSPENVRATPRAQRASADAEASKRSALLAEEAKVIDEARDAVATGDSARALRALAAHRQKFDKPLLRPEALFLEMRALAARGDRAAAARVAEELLRRYPNGPQAAAARGFLRTQDP